MKEQVYDLQSVANSPASERAAFIRRTYAHLAVALLGFIAVEYYLVHSSFAASLVSSMLGGMSWLIVLGLFMGVSYLANKLAASQTSQQMQYLGLGLFVVAEAIVFLPLLYIATFYAGEGLIATAGLMTLLLVGGITATVFITKKDFSFMGSVLSMGGFVALGFILCSMIFGFSLGLVFSRLWFCSREDLFFTVLLIFYTDIILTNMWRLHSPYLPRLLFSSFTSFRF
jgi:FtsH-binding integral membrane protein